MAGDPLENDHIPEWQLSEAEKESRMIKYLSK